jgi:hypothetical protein
MLLERGDDDAPFCSDGKCRYLLPATTCTVASEGTIAIIAINNNTDYDTIDNPLNGCDGRWEIEDEDAVHAYLPPLVSRI